MADIPQLAVVHNLNAYVYTLVVGRNILTIQTGTFHQQQQTQPLTTLECNYCYYNCIVFLERYFLIINIHSVNEFTYVAQSILSLVNQLGIYSLPVIDNLVWQWLMNLHFIWHHTSQHCQKMFKLNKYAKYLNHALSNQPTWIESNSSLLMCVNACSLQHYHLCFHPSCLFPSFCDLRLI